MDDSLHGLTAQVAVVVCEMAVHKRRPEELGFMSMEEFRESLAHASQQPTFIPSPGRKAVLLSNGYVAHIHQAKPPRDALSAPIPKHWKFAEPVQVKDVRIYCPPPSPPHLLISRASWKEIARIDPSAPRTIS